MIDVQILNNLRDWIIKVHPEYKSLEGCSILSMFTEYYVSSSPAEICNFVNYHIEEEAWQHFEKRDFSIAQVKAPEGFVYVVIRKNRQSIGFNVPLFVVQGKSEKE